MCGVLVSILGIVLVGGAGMSKENELPEEQKKAAVAEFNFKKGLLVAIFSGIDECCHEFRIARRPGHRKNRHATAPATSNTWKGMPVLVVVLLGGFVVNGGWCLFLNFKNKTIGDYGKSSAPIIPNLFFAAVAGAIWCSQFICLKTGEPAMGELLYRLGGADGQRNTIQHDPGHFFGRVEKHQQPDKNAAGAGIGVYWCFPPWFRDIAVTCEQ